MRRANLQRGPLRTPRTRRCCRQLCAPLTNKGSSHAPRRSCGEGRKRGEARAAWFRSVATQEPKQKAIGTNPSRLPVQNRQAGKKNCEMVQIKSMRCQAQPSGQREFAGAKRREFKDGAVGSLGCLPAAAACPRLVPSKRPIGAQCWCSPGCRRTPRRRAIGVLEGCGNPPVGWRSTQVLLLLRRCAASVCPTAAASPPPHFQGRGTALPVADVAARRAHACRDGR